MQEAWAKIPGHPLCRVSDRGVVWSTRWNRELKQSIDPQGNSRVRLSPGYSPKVKDLVAKAFLDAPDSVVVAHRDGDRQNNDAANLILVRR